MLFDASYDVLLYDLTRTYFECDVPTDEGLRRFGYSRDKRSDCLQVTLKQKAKLKAPGLTPRAILEKFKAMQTIDVHLPTTDGRNLVLPRHTQPEKDLQPLLHQLDIVLPEQPPPRLEALQGKCGADLGPITQGKSAF